MSGFWIDKNDVTVAEYKAFCQATGHTVPDAPSWGWQDDNPVVNVTWDDASAYGLGGSIHSYRGAMGEGGSRNGRSTVSLGQRMGSQAVCS